MNEIVRLICIARETKEIAKIVVPIITEIPIDKIPFNKYETLAFLTSRLSKLIITIIFSNDISIGELAQNNYEFLDTMKTALKLVEKQLNYIIKDNELEFIQNKIDKLISELNAPPFLQHRDKTPSDATKPDVTKRR